MYLLMIISIGGVHGVEKGSKFRIFLILRDFEPFSSTLYTPDTDYHEQTHIKDALYRWNPLPHERFGAKKCFSSGIFYLFCKHFPVYFLLKCMELDFGPCGNKEGPQKF